jgi:hypothetical protein
VPADPRKRELRKLKRTLKCAGSKHRRRELKKQFADNPEGAAEVTEDFGKFSSEGFNGLDQDATRKKASDE